MSGDRYPVCRSWSGDLRRADLREKPPADLPTFEAGRSGAHGLLDAFDRSSLGGGSDYPTTGNRLGLRLLPHRFAP